MKLELFFDHFGFLVWIFFVYIALVDLKNKKLKKWPKYILLIIGIIGIILDGTLLIAFYLNWDLVNYAWTFDHLGVPVFLFVIWLSIKDLKNKKINRNKLSKWLLFLIGIGGLLADSIILVKFYLYL